MSEPSRFGVRLAVAGAVVVAVFSALSTWLIQTGRWPELPPGALRDVDLWAGLVFLLVFVGAMLLKRRQKAEGGRQ